MRMPLNVHLMLKLHWMNLYSLPSGSINEAWTDNHKTVRPTIGWIMSPSSQTNHPRMTVWIWTSTVIYQSCLECRHMRFKNWVYRRIVQTNLLPMLFQQWMNSYTIWKKEITPTQTNQYIWTISSHPFTLPVRFSSNTIVWSIMSLCCVQQSYHILIWSWSQFVMNGVNV